MRSKICTQCRVEKDISFFAWRSKKRKKTSSECKECHKEMRLDYYKNNPGKEYSREKKESMK